MTRYRGQTHRNIHQARVGEQQMQRVDDGDGDGGVVLVGQDGGAGW